MARVRNPVVMNRQWSLDCVRGWSRGVIVVRCGSCLLGRAPVRLQAAALTMCVMVGQVSVEVAGTPRGAGQVWRMLYLTFDNRRLAGRWGL
jgi:hypothetical protein